MLHLIRRLQSFLLVLLRAIIINQLHIHSLDPLPQQHQILLWTIIIFVIIVRSLTWLVQLGLRVDRHSAIIRRVVPVRQYFLDPIVQHLAEKVMVAGCFGAHRSQLIVGMLLVCRLVAGCVHQVHWFIVVGIVVIADTNERLELSQLRGPLDWNPFVRSCLDILWFRSRHDLISV